MSSSARKLRFFLPTFLITLVIDQVTKLWIIERFAYGERLTVIEGFFNLTHVRNPGGAFSFLATMSEAIREAFFLGTGVLAIVSCSSFSGSSSRANGSPRPRSAACSAGRSAI